MFSIENQEQINAWVGIALAFTFSISIVAFFIKAVISKKEINWNIFIVLSVSLMLTVGLVGNTPFVSLFQNVAISIGCLFALYKYLGSDNPNPKVVLALSLTMITCLAINQASSTFKLGLLNLVSIETNPKYSDKEKNDAKSGKREPGIPVNSNPSTDNETGSDILKPGTWSLEMDKRYKLLSQFYDFYVQRHNFNVSEKQSFDKFS